MKSLADIILDIAQMKRLLEMACESVEHHADQDKRVYSAWYYDAKRLLGRLDGNDRF